MIKQFNAKLRKLEKEIGIGEKKEIQILRFVDAKEFIKAGKNGKHLKPFDVIITETQGKNYRTIDAESEEGKEILRQHK